VGMNKRHKEDEIFTPTNWECEMFPVPLRPYRGRAIVIMFPVERTRKVTFGDQEIDFLLPERVHVDDEFGARDVDMGAKYGSPDFGVVARFSPRLDSEGNYLYEVDKHIREGMVVAVKPFTGAWFTHREFDWIPEGRMIKILGTVDDIADNIIAEMVQDAA
jgi:hypothetical protein